MTTATPGSPKDPNSNGDAEGRDDVALMVNVEHPYQRIARVCRPVVERTWRSLKQSSPMTVLAWAAAIAGGLQFFAALVSSTPDAGLWFRIAQVVSGVPLLVVIAVAVARPTHRLTLLSIRIAALALWGISGAVVVWLGMRFFQPDAQFARWAGYLFPLYGLNVLLVPTALCVVLFRRSPSSSVSSSVTKPPEKLSS